MSGRAHCALPAARHIRTRACAEWKLPGPGGLAEPGGALPAPEAAHPGYNLGAPPAHAANVGAAPGQHYGSSEARRDSTAAPAPAQAPQPAARGPAVGAVARGAGHSSPQQPAAEPAGLRTGAGAAAGQPAAEQPAAGQQKWPAGRSAALHPAREPAGLQPSAAGRVADPRLAAARHAEPRSWNLLTQVDEGFQPAAKLPWEAARAGDLLRAPQPANAQVRQSAGRGVDSRGGAGGAALALGGIGSGLGPPAGAGPAPRAEAGAGQTSPLRPQQRAGADAAHAAPTGSPEGAGQGADAQAAREGLRSGPLLRSPQVLGQPREGGGPGGVADPVVGLDDTVRSSPAFSSQPAVASPDVVARLDFGARDKRAHDDADAASCARLPVGSFLEALSDPWRLCKDGLCC